uniref:Glycogen synthase kinase binding protein n=1 Tax=Anabas testudineus TaxID=64144 RepID=A0AAQ6IIU0_ANATE
MYKSPTPPRWKDGTVHDASSIVYKSTVVVAQCRAARRGPPAARRGPPAGHSSTERSPSRAQQHGEVPQPHGEVPQPHGEVPQPHGEVPQPGTAARRGPPAGHSSTERSPSRAQQHGEVPQPHGEVPQPHGEVPQPGTAARRGPPAGHSSTERSPSRAQQHGEVPQPATAARRGPPAARRGPPAGHSSTATMPCRKENYIFLEQSVTVGSKEVDALVTKIGEALQLHNNSGGHQKTVSVSMSCLHGLTGSSAGGVKPAALIGRSTGATVQKRTGCCMRLRNHRGSSRASPYSIPGSNGDQDWDQIKPWNKKRLRGEDDDPHRLLQELILSGNLIKEAVRRLQFSAADCGDFPKAVDNVPCS